MNRRRMVALLLALLALGMGTCGSRGSSIQTKELPEFAEQTRLASYRFTGHRELAGHRVDIQGLVEDDYRYQASVLLDGTPVYDEVVVDNRRYVRLLAPNKIVPADLLPELPSLHPTWSSLVGGVWVVDAEGAPPEFTAGANPINAPLTPELVLSTVRYLDDPETLLGGRFREYNTKATYYLPKDDKFPVHKDDGARFDSLPQPYDPNGVFTGLDSARKYFEYVSVWAKPGAVTRIEKVAQLPDPKDDRYNDLYQQLGRAGSRTLLDLLGTKEGRKFAERYTFSSAKGETVAEPPDATAAPLTPALTTLAERLAGLEAASPLYGKVE